MIRDWAMNLFYTNNDPTGKVADGNQTRVDVHRNISLTAVVNTHDWQNDLDAEMFQGYSPALLTFASVCCVVYMMVGVPGNLITIIALFRCKKVSAFTCRFIALKRKTTFRWKRIIESRRVGRTDTVDVGNRNRTLLWGRRSKTTPIAVRRFCFSFTLISRDDDHVRTCRTSKWRRCFFLKPARTEYD